MTRVLLITFLCCSVAWGGQTTRRSDKASILELEELWRKAQHDNDKAAFDRLLASDVSFVGTSGSLRDKKDYIASRAGSWIPHATTYTIRDLSVRFYGQVAIVTGTEETTGEGVANKGRLHMFGRDVPDIGNWLLFSAPISRHPDGPAQQIVGCERRERFSQHD